MMRWEDQELNYGTAEDFPEVVFAFHSLLQRAEKCRTFYVCGNQAVLDEMIADGRMSKNSRGSE